MDAGVCSNSSNSDVQSTSIKSRGVIMIPPLMPLMTNCSVPLAVTNADPNNLNKAAMEEDNTGEVGVSGNGKNNMNSLPSKPRQSKKLKSGSTAGKRLQKSNNSNKNNDNDNNNEEEDDDDDRDGADPSLMTTEQRIERW